MKVTQQLESYTAATLPDSVWLQTDTLMCALASLALSFSVVKQSRHGMATGVVLRLMNMHKLVFK